MYVKLKRKSININRNKKTTATNSRTAVNSQPSAFTLLNFNTKGVLYGTDRKVFRRN